MESSDSLLIYFCQYQDNSTRKALIRPRREILLQNLSMKMISRHSIRLQVHKKNCQDRHKMPCAMSRFKDTRTWQPLELVSISKNSTPETGRGGTTTHKGSHSRISFTESKLQKFGMNPLQAKVTAASYLSRFQTGRTIAS